MIFVSLEILIIFMVYKHGITGLSLCIALPANCWASFTTNNNIFYQVLTNHTNTSFTQGLYETLPVENHLKCSHNSITSTSYG